MAKKQIAPEDEKEGSGTMRAQKTDAKKLRELAAVLQAALTVIEGKAQHMEDNSMKPVYIEGWQGIETAKQNLRTLVASCHRHIPDF